MLQVHTFKLRVSLLFSIQQKKWFFTKMQKTGYLTWFCVICLWNQISLHDNFSKIKWNSLWNLLVRLTGRPTVYINNAQNPLKRSLQSICHCLDRFLHWDLETINLYNGSPWYIRPWYVHSNIQCIQQQLSLYKGHWLVQTNTPPNR